MDEDKGYLSYHADLRHERISAYTAHDRLSWLHALLRCIHFIAIIVAEMVTSSMMTGHMSLFTMDMLTRLGRPEGKWTRPCKQVTTVNIVTVS